MLEKDQLTDRKRANLPRLGEGRGEGSYLKERVAADETQLTRYFLLKYYNEFPLTLPLVLVWNQSSLRFIPLGGA